MHFELFPRRKVRESLCASIICRQDTSENANKCIDYTDDINAWKKSETSTDIPLDYVEGKGYCASQYDENGCNQCNLSYVPEAKSGNRWKWSCTLMYCEKSDPERVNKCLEYIDDHGVNSIKRSFIKEFPD